MPSSDQNHEPYAHRVDVPQPLGAAALSESSDLPSSSGRRLLSRVMAELSVTFATIVSLLPRGMLIATVAAVPAQGIARNHPRAVDRMDRASLRLMSARRPIRLSDQPSAGHRRAVEPVLGRAMGGQLDDALVIAVDSPVVAGYGGALVAARVSGEGPFGDEEVRKLATLAAEFSRDRASEIGARLVERHTRADWARAIRMLAPHRGAAIFDTDGKLLHPRAADGEPVPDIDPSLQQQMSDTARELAAARQGVITRWMARAASGVLVPYRVVRHGPASSGGNAPDRADETTIWFSRTPTPTEFLSIDPADLVSEPDMARMLPAMRFMRESFASMPSLDQIARQVHLSPFHFHRRFTDLLGVTPKHFLLDCQIEQAQIELLAGRLSLAEIAASCGFSHQSHFTSRFKQATGLTPVQWRSRAVAG
jgi:AraC-like DNA-binding protein